MTFVKAIPTATCLVAALVFVSSALAQDGQYTSSGDLRSENGMVKFVKNIDIPAEVEGKLTKLMIDEGSSIKADEILAAIDDTAAELAVELKRAEEQEFVLNAMNDVNLRDAENTRELAVAEAESYKELFKKGAVPYYEKEKKELEAIRATLRIELSERQMMVEKAKLLAKRAELRIAEHELTKRRVRAPFSGYVQEKFIELGEWVQPGTPIANLVQLDRMKIEGDIKALGNSDRVYAGAPCIVYITVGGPADQRLSIESKIKSVSAEINALNAYQVTVEVDNVQQNGRWIIKPGMEAEIVLQ